MRSYAAALGVAWDAFFDVPYSPVPPEEGKTDWKGGFDDPDIPTAAQAARYLNIVRLLRNMIGSTGIPELPASMENLTLSGANAIEEVLEVVDRRATELREEKELLLDNTSRAWFFAGDVFSGEVFA